VVTLEDGGVTFLVRAQAPEERFLVKTADAEVEVRGTVFRVEAKATRIRAVLVSEGKVLVRFAGETTFVEGGESWRPPPEPPQDEAASETASPPATTVPPPPHPAAVKTLPRAAATKPETEGATKDFVDGVHMIERGDYGAAADRLEAFSAAHPKDSSAEDAAFLAILALQRAGRLSEAVAAAKRYLDRYPQGYRRAEAEQIAAGTAQR
jgi:TolA-binding protein